MGVRLTAGGGGALQESLDYLFARTTGGFKFGLERTEALLAALGQPHRAYKVIHVAGTNGKGSSLATASTLLRSRGLRVGKYTSPHLVDFRERILVDGVPIEADDVVQFVERWTPLVEELGATFFEATTAMAFDAFARADVDVALIETGLGGRLDSTNVVDPVAAGVISISFDHMEYLGHTLEEIAAEKAGIFKPGRPAVIGYTDAPILELMRARAIEVGATPTVVEDAIRISDIDVQPSGTAATFETRDECVRLTTPLTGRHQAFNLAFTLALLDAAGDDYRFSLSQAAPLLTNVALPGRFQRRGRYIFDVAHNADGAGVLAETLAAVRPEEPVRVLFCALRDKEWQEMLAALAPAADAFILTNAPTAPASRAWDLAAAAEFAAGLGIPTLAEADFDAALERTGDDAGTVVVTGSFHTVGDAMARLQVSPFVP